MFKRYNPKARCWLKTQSPNADRTFGETSAGISIAVRIWTKERMSRLASAPQRDTHVPSTQDILVGLANATNSRFFTDCYSDSASITPSAGHTRPRAPRQSEGMKYRTFYVFKRTSLQVHLAAQKRRNVEWVVLRLRVHGSSTPAPFTLRHAPLCELRG